MNDSDYLARVERVLADSQSSRLTGSDAQNRGVAFRLRQLAGVREEVLDRFPAERAKFTALGGVILGTATIAGTSMWFAIHDALNQSWLVAAGIAAIWALFIANLDRWLVVSLSGASGRLRTVSVAVPRLLLAILFAFIIAEPFVLRIFQSEIETYVIQERQDGIATLEANLTDCNPSTPTSVNTLPARCLRPEANLRLNIDGDPSAVLAQRSRLEDQLAEAETGLKEARETLLTLETKASNECNGTSGAGLTGQFGDGINCQFNRRAAEEFRESANLNARQQQVDQLRTQLTATVANSSAAQSGYAAKVADAISDRVAELETSYGSGDIGLLDRVRALGAISSSNSFVWTAQWALRLFFVVIECMPVLVKLMSGRSAYEIFSNDETAVARGVAEEESRAKAAVLSLSSRIQRQLAAYREERSRLDLEEQAKLERATRRATSRAHIRERTNHAIRQEKLRRSGDPKTHFNGEHSETRIIDLGERESFADDA